jgi:hypothetical protein
VIAYSFRGRAPRVDRAPFRLNGQGDTVALEATDRAALSPLTATATLGDA